MFFSGIPLEDQAGPGSGGQAGERRAGFYTQPRKLGGGTPQTFATTGSGRTQMMLEEDNPSGTRGRRFWRALHRRFVGFTAGAIAGAATSGASAVIFRPEGRIAQAAPDVARSALRGTAFGAGFSGRLRSIREDTVNAILFGADFVDTVFQEQIDQGMTTISVGLEILEFGWFLGRSWRFRP